MDSTTVFGILPHLNIRILCRSLRLVYPRAAKPVKAKVRHPVKFMKKVLTHVQLAPKMRASTEEAHFAVGTARS